MRTKYDHLALAGERAHEDFQDTRGADVQARERLVEHNQSWVVEDGRGDQDLLSHAFRKVDIVWYRSSYRSKTWRSRSIFPSSLASGIFRRRPTSCKYSGPVIYE